MRGAVSGQDEPNIALRFATRAGKMELFCPLGIRALSRKYTNHALVFFSHIINPLLTKLSRSKWLDIGQVLFLRVYGPGLRLARKELGQYPAILTSRLANNPYMFLDQNPIAEHFNLDITKPRNSEATKTSVFPLF